MNDLDKAAKLWKKLLKIDGVRRADLKKLLELTWNTAYACGLKSKSYRSDVKFKLNQRAWDQ